MKIGRHIQDDMYTPFEIVDKIKILGIVFENGKRTADIDKNWTGSSRSRSSSRSSSSRSSSSSSNRILMSCQPHRVWTGRIEKLTRIIQLWSKRDLRIMGKIVIVKCFLMSQLIYIMQSVGLPEKVLIDVNRLFYKLYGRRDFLSI